MHKRSKIVGEKTLSHEWGRLSRYAIDYRRSSGRVQRLRREVYDHGNAAAVLLCDPGRDVVILVRQYRLPVELGGDDPELYEVCAGLLDGDSPEACARREAEEETGYRVGRLVHAFDAYTSPGSLTEKCSCFVGICEGARIAPGGGIADEGEDIEVVELASGRALAMIGEGAIVDLKTIALLQHAALGGVFGRAAGPA